MTLSPGEAIVLAGGAGTRLRSVLPDTPKVLAPIHGRPFLDHLLEWMSGRGIESMVLATGYAADAVEAVASKHPGVTFSRESEPLGTGGAIASAFASIRGDRAWVFNGDSFCDADLASVAEATAHSPEDAWLVAVEVADAGRFGTLELDGSRVVRFLEKTGRREAGWINAGIYILPRALASQARQSIERDFFPAWAAQGRLRAARVRARFIDIGTPESLAAAESFFG